MKTPLLRHEIRRRTILLALCVPAVFLAGMGLGYSMAEAGFIHTVSVILIGAGVGICIHKLTHPIL